MLTVRLYFTHKEKLYEKYFSITPPERIKDNYEQHEAFLIEWGKVTMRKWFKEETGEDLKEGLEFKQIDKTI